MTFAENDLFSLLWWLAEMLLLSFGLWLIGGKMGYRRRWMFWVPGARYIALGDALDMDADGVICCGSSIWSSSANRSASSFPC